MSAKINHQAREAQIKQFEAIQKESAEIYDCVDCAWEGPKSQLGRWLFGGKAFCPECGDSRWLVTRAEYNKMMDEDDTCQLEADLNSRTAS
ncbi:hypothetical protein V6238_01550 [Marinomonas arenicola]|uniref:hypothetical protein n=1 Tax=Marinomonas arenicola TaxID=569601 RepID=UPI00311FC6E4